MASLFDQVTAKNNATTAFQKKWGGVIHPGYTKGGDLSSNDFVGTATQKDVVETLLAGGNSGNLAVWLKENNVNVNDLATTTNASSWMQPIKQTALRQQIAAREQFLNSKQSNTRNVASVIGNLDFTDLGQGGARSRQTFQTPLEPEPVLEEGRNEIRPINNTSPQPATLSKLKSIPGVPQKEEKKQGCTNCDKKNNLPLIAGIVVLSVVTFFIIRRLRN